MQDDVTNKVAARQLGYYLFWNLRANASGLALSNADVCEAAYNAGLKHADSAWQLLDRNGDSEASLDEVVHAVEDVYSNRRSLAATLQDNQTVVAQVERLIWAALIVLLVFVAFAIFDAGALASTWPGLSAGLLSFSFIFSNSIRTVRAHAAASTRLQRCDDAHTCLTSLRGAVPQSHGADSPVAIACGSCMWGHDCFMCFAMRP